MNVDDGVCMDDMQADYESDLDNAIRKPKTEHRLESILHASRGATSKVVKEHKTNTTNKDVYNKKLTALTPLIKKDTQACDLSWSLFSSACYSYRFDSVLKPFPPFYVHEAVKNIEELRSTAETCPSMPVLLEQLCQGCVNSTLLELVYFVLVTNNEPKLALVPKTEHSTVMSLVDSKTVSAPPNYIFKVIYNRSSVSETKFQEKVDQYSSRYAFHGSRLDNFYSILRHGLQLSLNKVAAFGPGIYLSSELNVSLPYSPTGFTWGGSLFGSEMSIVSLCQMIDHPDVKCQDKSGATSRAYAKDGENQIVPLKYFIVQNSDLVKVRYLLLYSHDNQREQDSSTPLSWISQHKLLTAIIGYVFFLASVGVKDSPIVRRFLRQFFRRLGL